MKKTFSSSLLFGKEVYFVVFPIPRSPAIDAVEWGGMYAINQFEVNKRKYLICLTHFVAICWNALLRGCK